MSSRIILVIMGLCCSKETSASSLGIPTLLGRDIALSGEIVDFYCEVEEYKDEYILLQLYKEEDQSKPLGDYSSIDGDKANFPLLVTTAHDGYLVCKATVQNDSLVAPTYSNRHYFKVIEPVEVSELVIQSGSAEFFEGKTLVLRCITKGNYISYSWLVNGLPVPKTQRHKTHLDLLYIYRSTPRDSGSYICMASNQFNETQVYKSNSSEVTITVKELVSEPDISFTVVKHQLLNISAMVTCQSTRGTPPITFSLYNRTELISSVTVQDRITTFPVPVILDRHMGLLQCQANNGANLTRSQWLDLKVVPVGGPVLIHYDYDVGENYIITGVRLYCMAAKGTHPQYQWFLNGSLLEGQGTFYRVVHQPPQQSILFLALRKSSAGTYQCEASNSFDNTTTIRSERLYVDKEVVNRLPVSVVAVVFGCFIFLVALVSTCCCVSVVYRRDLYGEKTPWDGEMEKMAISVEELDLDEYRDDTDLFESTGIDDNYQGSLSSIDFMQPFQTLSRPKHSLEDLRDE